jgi:hypothetical protein
MSIVDLILIKSGLVALNWAFRRMAESRLLDEVRVVPRLLLQLLLLPLIRYETATATRYLSIHYRFYL